MFSGITSTRFPQRLKGDILAMELGDWTPADEFQIDVALRGDVIFATEPKRFDALGLALPAWITMPLDGAVLPDEGPYVISMKVGAKTVAQRSWLAVRAVSNAEQVM